MTRKQIEEKVIDKLLNDMIFCFECDNSEKIDILENIGSIETSYLLNYLND